MCQTKSVSAIMSQQFSGLVSLCPACLKAGQVKNGPTPSRANFLGKPRNSGRNGVPSRISGGATDMSNKCCTMCAESSKPEKASSVEAIASQTVPRPARKASARHPGKRAGEVRCKMRQPRRYRMITATIPSVIQGSKDQELRIAWETDDIGSWFPRASAGLLRCHAYEGCILSGWLVRWV